MGLLDHLTGFWLPLAGALAAFAAAAGSWAYVPVIGRQLAAAPAALGLVLLGASGGYMVASNDCATAQLRDQADRLKASLESLKGTTEVVAGLHERMSDQARQAVAVAAEQRVQADDLIRKLQAQPMPSGCNWAPNELDGVRSIRIYRERERSGSAAR
jgi:hypothetical protein